MRFLILITSMACLLFASGDSAELFLFRVLEGHGPAEKNFDPISSCSGFLQEIEAVSDIIVIERREAPCGALDEDIPCDVILVFSAILGEYITIDEPRLLILGLPGPAGERVIMLTPGRIVTRITLTALEKDHDVTEICLEHFSEKGFRICPEPDYSDLTAGSKFTMARRVTSEGEIQYVCDLPLGTWQADQIRIHQALDLQD